MQMLIVLNGRGPIRSIDTGEVPLGITNTGQFKSLKLNLKGTSAVSNLNIFLLKGVC